MSFLLLIIFSLTGGLGAVLLSSIFFVFPARVRDILVPCLISYSTGTFLGLAFLGLIPNALLGLPVETATKTVLGGIVLFFTLEKFLIWHHCHDETCEGHGATVPIILVGSGVHDMIDGINIAAAFVASVPLGIATSIAIIAHEVPKDVGNSAILLQQGLSRKKALLLNALASLTTLVGAVLAYLYLSEVRRVVPYVMALSAGNFIYMSVAHLVPHLHRYGKISQSFRQVALLLLGIGTIAFLRMHHH